MGVGGIRGTDITSKGKGVTCNAVWGLVGVKEQVSPVIVSGVCVCSALIELPTAALVLFA